MSVNILPLLKTINTKSSSSAQDTVKLAIGITNLPVNKVDIVQLYSSLPNAKYNRGKLFLVDEYKVVYYSNGNEWITFSNWQYPSLYFCGDCASGWTSGISSPILSYSSPVMQLPPSNTWRWKQIGAGYRECHAIKSDGTLWTWGYNLYGQLGIGSTAGKSSPVSLIAPANSWTWKQISDSSFYSSCAVRSDNTIWSWGYNYNGQLGDGTTANKSSPVSLVSPCNSWAWKQVSSDYSLTAIRSDDTIWTWGSSQYGQLGDGTTVNKTSPVSLIAPCNSWTWKQVSSSSAVVAIKSDDTIWSWGYNSQGGLGDGTTANKSSPVSLVSPFNSWTWKQVSCSSANYLHTLAIKSDDTLWGWGGNINGSLGDGTTTSYSSPVSIVGGFTWKQVSAGYRCTYAIKSDDTLWSWGYNISGALGVNNATASYTSPVSVVGGFTWKQISAFKNNDAFVGLTTAQSVY